MEKARETISALIVASLMCAAILYVVLTAPERAAQAATAPGKAVGVQVNGVTTNYDTLQAAWTAANESAGDVYVTLFQNVQTPVTLTVAANKTIILYLNGYMLSLGTPADSRFAANDSVLTVLGNLVVSDGIAPKDAPAVLYKAVSEANASRKHDVFDPVRQTTVSVKGGLITGGRGGGVLIAESGKFTLKSGTIAGNTAFYGGGVRVEGEFAMEGGAIAYNKAESAGGVYALGSGVALNLYGGSIVKNGTDNTDSVGGLFAESAAVRVAGTPEIGENMAGGEERNLYVVNHAIVVDGALYEGDRRARICVYPQKIGADGVGAPIPLTSGFGAHNAEIAPRDVFFCDGHAYCVKGEGGEAVFGEHVWICDGVLDEVHHKTICTACGATGTEAHAFNHVTEDAFKKSDANCLHGAVYYESCACGKTGDPFEYGPLGAAHVFGAWINEVPATTTAVGTKGHRDCEICHKHFDEHDAEINDLTIPILKETISPEGLPKGAVAGIVIADAVLLCAVVCVVVGMVRYKRKCTEK